MTIVVRTPRIRITRTYKYRAAHQERSSLTSSVRRVKLEKEEGRVDVMGSFEEFYQPENILDLGV